MPHHTKQRILVLVAIITASVSNAVAQTMVYPSMPMAAPYSLPYNYGRPAVPNYTPPTSAWPFMPSPQLAAPRYPPYGIPMTAYPYPQPIPPFNYGQGSAQNVATPQAQSAAPRYPSPYNPAVPARPGPRPAPPPTPKQPSKPWGDTRHIWPDFYTDFTGDFWDKMINAPYDMGYMPGGWRFPSFSSPDPVTVGDAVTNQIPPIMEEVPNFMDFNN